MTGALERLLQWIWIRRPEGQDDPRLREGRVPKWIIEPVKSDLPSRIREFWRYRGILRYSAVRSIRTLYQGSATSIFFTMGRPLIPIFISTLVFGKLLSVPSDGVPYFLFFLTGTASWRLFERSALWATRSLDQNKGLIKKVYFPRLIVPISSVTPAIVDVAVYMALVMLSGVYYLVKDGRWYLSLGPGLLASALAAIMSVVFAIAIGLFTCVWQTKFRELRYTLRYFMRFWHYLTPVLYPLSHVPEKYHWLIFLNPMAPIVETFKWGVLGTGQFPAMGLVTASVFIGVTLATGIWYFSTVESTSIDRM